MPFEPSEYLTYLMTLDTFSTVQHELEALVLAQNNMKERKWTQNKAQYIYKNNRLFQMITYSFSALSHLAMLLPPHEALALINHLKSLEVILSKNIERDQLEAAIDKITARHCV